MKIVFNTFNGMLPRPNVGIKPDNCAKVAWNCDLRDGRLRPLKQALLVSSNYPVVNADYSDADDGAAVKHLRFVHRVSGDVILWWASEKEVAEVNIQTEICKSGIPSGFFLGAAIPDIFLSSIEQEPCTRQHRNIAPEVFPPKQPDGCILAVPETIPVRI